MLKGQGIPARAAHTLADRWLIHGDFLLVDLDGPFEFIIGNPPYVRQELIPDALLAEYRSRYATIYDRADLYVPFIERSLTSLAPGGHLGFICADRWMKNRYGGPLRQLVAERFHFKIYVDMVDTVAFQTDVIAYPAITIISRQTPGSTRIAHRPEIGRSALSKLAAQLLSPRLGKKNGAARELQKVAAGAEPWILESADHLALVRRLEAAFPTLEEAGCKVGIGVATGADSIFIGPFDALDVEPSRKLPLVMTGDILNGNVQWRGFGVINPFADRGGLVRLEDYPRLKMYLERNKREISERHCAQKAPANWYRTIDRIYPALARVPKLPLSRCRKARSFVPMTSSRENVAIADDPVNQGLVTLNKMFWGGSYASVSAVLISTLSLMSAVVFGSSAWALNLSFGAIKGRPSEPRLQHSTYLVQDGSDRSGGRSDQIDVLRIAHRCGEMELIRRGTASKPKL